MSRSKIIFIAIICLFILAVTYAMKSGKPQSASVAQDVKPALTITIVQPETQIWLEQIMATGTVQAWQESIIGPEISGLRLTEVLANVGDQVKKGALLARFSDEMVLNGVLQQQAAFADAKARFAEAQLNARRADQLKNHMSRFDALVDSCNKRARPIVMTTIAMGAGMLPIALGLGADPSFRVPMATAVIGGLITSTLLSLFVVPVVFTYVDDIFEKFKTFAGRGGNTSGKQV